MPTGQLDELDRLIKKHGLTQARAEIVAAAKPCVLVRTTAPDRYGELGNSRIGGLPDLPPEMKWPQTDGEYFAFLGQIRLADLAGMSQDLPPSGMLYMFLGDNSGASDVEVQVLHFDGKLESLRRVDVPPDAEFRHDDEDYRGSPHRVAFQQGLSLSYRLPCNLRRAGRFTDEECDQYASLASEWLTPALESHQLLGNTRFGLYDPLDAAAKSKGGSLDKWRLLLALFYDEKVGFCFWDAGELSILIRDQDLAAARFDSLYACIESG